MLQESTLPAPPLLTRSPNHMVGSPDTLLRQDERIFLLMSCIYGTCILHLVRYSGHTRPIPKKVVKFVMQTLGKDWRGLADKMGFTYNMMKVLQTHST